MKNKLISQVGENILINILLDKRDKLLKDTYKIIKDSYHDDAALIENNSRYTVISTDMLIEHSHFPRGMTHYQMGAKCVTVNVSDILAMNAKPTSILVALGLTADMTLKEYEELTDGILDKCLEYDITLIGGDINQNTEIILSGTSTGIADDNIKLQKCIGNDDLIAVTGNLGGPAAAYDYIYHNRINENVENILDTLMFPTLPLNESEIFRRIPGLTSSITDITDGLAVELGHLHDKNENIGFEIYYDKLPYDKLVKKIATANNKDLSEYLLNFGEEFELLVTLNKEEYDKHKDILSNITIIGKSNKSGKITLIRDDKEEVINIKGYEHLKDD